MTTKTIFRRGDDDSSLVFFASSFLVTIDLQKRQSSWPCQAEKRQTTATHLAPFSPDSSFRQQTKKKMPPNYPWSRRAAVPFDDGHPRQRNLPGNSTDDTTQGRSVFVFSSFRFLRLLLRPRVCPFSFDGFFGETTMTRKEEESPF